MNRKKILCLLLSLLMLSSLIGCGEEETTAQTERPSSETTQESTDPGFETDHTSETESASVSEPISTATEETESETEPVVQNFFDVTPVEDEKITLANEEVFTWWKTFHWVKTDTEPFCQQKADLYYPIPVTFSWRVAEEPDYYRLTISLNADLCDGESYLLSEPTLTLEHLFVSSVYYWQVDAVYADRTLRSALYSFETVDSPRALRIEGVSNTRDIGGMAAADGYRIKQGMVYRGGKLEDITPEGRDFFVNVLGLKTDLDLRTVGEGGAGVKSPLGDHINYVNMTGRYYVGGTGISNEEGKAAFAEEVRLFADPDNYPIYIHCSLGRDRTGTLALVIEGLLGVDKNTLMMDYELSFFSVTGTLDNASVAGMRGAIRPTYDYLNSFEGENFSERVENYLLSIGITAEEIASIREILLEEVK